MKRWILMLGLAAIAPGVVTASGLLGLGASAEVDGVARNDGAAPEASPQRVWVAAFATDLADVRTDPGGPLQRRQAPASDPGNPPDTANKTLRGSVRESLGTLRQGLLGGGDASMVGDDAGAVRAKSAAHLQQALVKQLNEAGIPAQAWTDGSHRPTTGVLLDGQFLTIDEGSQLRRTAVGLGAGQSYVSTQVQVYNAGDPSAPPFLTFHTDGDSGASPGLLVGGAVGSAVTGTAAVGAGVSGYRGAQKGTPKDLDNTATSITAYLTDFWKARDWLTTAD